MLRKFFIIFIFVISIHPLAWADTIYFKDGKVLKGKVVEKKPDFIYINVDGVIDAYGLSDIEKIVEDKKAKKPVAEVPEKKISLEKRELILQFVEANKTRENMQIVFSRLLAQIPPEKQQAYQSILQVNDIIEALIPVYDKHFNEEELKELILFYRSPLGQKMIEVTPLLMQESMEVTYKYFKEKIAEFK